MFKSLLFLQCCWFYSAIVHGIGPIESWEYSPSTLSVTRYYGFIAYSAESTYSDCIFVFGGVGCTTCMECYNITDNTISTFDTLTTGGYNEVQPNSVIIVDNDANTELLYFITRDGYLQKYDLLTKTESTKYYNSAALQSCLLKNENNNELYIVDGSSGSSFWIYDLIDGEQVTGPSLTYTRDDQVCATSYWNEDEPYLYVLGGNAGYIERIKIDGLLSDIENGINEYDWELLLLQLTSSIDDRCTFTYQTTSRLMSVVSYRNYIYLITGYDGAAEGDIIYLDVENWELKYVGEYIGARYGLRCQYASLAERVYCFGGYTGTATTNTIAYSNIVPTLEPTATPSVNPTPSPSNNPTDRPTALPTIPTIAPSPNPTDNFTTTIHPTPKPTPKPTSKPTDNPTTKSPTSTPTDKPTSVSAGTPTKTPTQAPNSNSGLTSSSSGGSSSLSTDDPLVIAMIVFFSVFGACCCCISFCIIGYIGYSKCWKPHNDRIKRENQLNFQQSQGLVQVHSAPVSPRPIVRLNSDSGFGAAGVNLGANGIKQYFSTLGTGAYAVGGGGEAGDNNNNMGTTPGGPQSELIYIDGRPVVIRDNYATNANFVQQQQQQQQYGSGMASDGFVTGQVQYGVARNGQRIVLAAPPGQGQNHGKRVKNKNRNKNGGARGGNNGNNNNNNNNNGNVGGVNNGDELEIEMKPIEDALSNRFEVNPNAIVNAMNITNDDSDDGSLLGRMNEENNETNNNQNNQGEQMENGL